MGTPKAVIALRLLPTFRQATAIVMRRIITITRRKTRVTNFSTSEIHATHRQTSLSFVTGSSSSGRFTAASQASRMH